MPQFPRARQSQSLAVFTPSDGSGTWLPRPLPCEAAFRGFPAVLTVASWNLWHGAPGPGVRAAAAIDHIKQVSHLARMPDEENAPPEALVVMLQEVCSESLDAILAHPWIRANFAITDTEPPVVGFTRRKSGKFTWTRETADYFTLVLVPRDAPVAGCFRVSFDPTLSGRDALFVDLAVGNQGAGTSGAECIRLGTTHLESMIVPGDIRAGQLELAARWLKEDAAGGDTEGDAAEGNAEGDIRPSKVVAGILAGDLNPLQTVEHGFPLRPEIALRDVWTASSSGSPKAVDGTEDDGRPGVRDETFGRAKGNTWGYQSKPPSHSKKRLDKVLMWDGAGARHDSGLTLRAIPFRGDQDRGEPGVDVSGAVLRFGIGLTATVDAWEVARLRRRKGAAIGPAVKKPKKQIVSSRELDKMRQRNMRMEAVVRKSGLEWWVSDHYGIAARFELYRK